MTERKRYWLHRKGTNTVIQWNPEAAKMDDMETCTEEQARHYQDLLAKEQAANVLAKSIGVAPELEGLSPEEARKQREIDEGLRPPDDAPAKKSGKKSLSDMSQQELLTFAKESKLPVDPGATAEELRIMITEAHANLTSAATTPSKPPTALEDDLTQLGLGELNKLCDEYGLKKNGSNDEKRARIRAQRKAAQ